MLVRNHFCERVAHAALYKLTYQLERIFLINYDSVKFSTVTQIQAQFNEHAQASNSHI